MVGRSVAASAGGPLPTFPRDHLVAVRATHLLTKLGKTARIEFEVQDLGPSPWYRKGPTRCDLDNLIQVFLDAFEGTFFANDNQVSELIVRRELAP